MVEFTVSELGTVLNPVVVENCGRFRNRRGHAACVDKPHGVFDLAAIKAVRKFKYKPTVIGGKQVATYGVRTKITFRWETG